jgi:hypothetical protein
VPDYELLGVPSVDRWLTPVYSGIALTSQTVTVGRAFLAQFSLNGPRLIDGVAYIVGATAAGNVRVGIIGPIATTADAATGAPVLAQSASVAQGTANTMQVVTFTATWASAGIYYAALMGDNVTGTYMRLGNQAQAPGITLTYDRAGGYGAFTDPTPATTDSGISVPGLRVRLA